MEEVRNLWPIFAAVVIFVSNTIQWLLTKAKLTASGERIAQLQSDITSLRREADKLNNPSSYVKCAKLQRTANSKERELVEITGSMSKEGRSRVEWGLLVAKVAVGALVLLLCWGRPMAFVQEPRQLWPLGRMLSIPHSGSFQPTGAVAVVPWLSLCDRVSSLLVRVVLPLRTASAGRVGGGVMGKVE